MGAEGQQMRSGGILSAGAPHGLAIQGDRFGVVGGTGGCDPGRQHHFDLLRIQTREQAAIQ